MAGLVVTVPIIVYLALSTSIRYRARSWADGQRQHEADLLDTRPVPLLLGVQELLERCTCRISGRVRVPARDGDHDGIAHDVARLGHLDHEGSVVTLSLIHISE